MTSGPTDDHVSLRLAVKDDLPLIESLTSDPDVAGEFAQFGWFDPRLWRRRWEENELLGPDGGLLPLAPGGPAAGSARVALIRTGR